ncbi:MAG: homocysteine S-methyltransferase family protein [Nitrososphaera sp.]|jgi:5-methyltetrahydrofolate--homocysteine methyltransferase
MHKSSLLPESFLEALKKRVLVFDGAMGTEIQKLTPRPEDFPEGKDGFNDGLILSRPEWIMQIHRSYLAAGADCIETNTFGSNKLKLDEYGYGGQTVEFNRRAAELARKSCSEFDKPRYVIGSMGPSGFLPSSNDPDLGQKPLDEIQEAFSLQAEGLILGGADALLIETSQDILEVKLAIQGCHAAFDRTGKRIPIIANVTLDQYGKMLLGTSVQAAYVTATGMGIDAFGLNCSTGPAEMEPSVRWLGEQGEIPVLVMPNAGMPQNEGGRAVYKMGPEAISSSLAEFVSRYPAVRMVGGCCGTTPDHIRELRRAIDGKNS